MFIGAQFRQFQSVIGWTRGFQDSSMARGGTNGRNPCHSAIVYSMARTWGKKGELGAPQAL